MVVKLKNGATTFRQVIRHLDKRNPLSHILSPRVFRDSKLEKMASLRFFQGSTVQFKIKSVDSFLWVGNSNLLLVSSNSNTLPKIQE